MNAIEKRLSALLGETWKEATPGLCVQAFSGGRKVIDLELGDTYEIYDWASLTKIVFTTTALMFLHDEGKFKTTDRVHDWVEWFPEEAPWRIRDLMTHSASLAWWFPFYREMSKRTNARTPPERAWEIFQSILKPKILADLKRQRRKIAKPKSVYSDLDFFMLGIALEQISEASLYETWQDVKDRLGLRLTDFNYGNQPKFAKSKYAPTEKGGFRKRTMQGEVHDENTWTLRGVAPHAGLFGPLEELSQWGLLLRAGMRGKRSKNFPSPETVKLFTKRSIPRARGDWALGMMMPTKGTTSCGPKFSLKSVGHTGFTGTSLWYDPVKDLLVTILSNRVHPTRENRKFLELRPQIHSFIVDSL